MRLMGPFNTTSKFLVQFVLFFIFIAKIIGAIPHQEVYLFSEGQPVFNYNHLLKSLKSGDILTFDNQTRYQFIDYLGAGNTTQIIEVAAIDNPTNPGPFAMRLPKANGIFHNHVFELPYYEFLNFFMRNKAPLEKAKLIPQVHSELAGQYVLLDKVNLDFNLTQFLNFSIPIGDNIRTAAEDALLEFSEKLAPFIEIGDFWTDQVVFDGEKWILLDFVHANLLEGKVEPLTVKTKNPIWEILLYFPYKLSGDAVRYSHKQLSIINQIIYIERLKMIVSGKNSLTGVPIFLLSDDNHREKYIYEDIKKMKAAEQKNGCFHFYLKNSITRKESLL
jgi:hypothetical protein